MDLKAIPYSTNVSFLSAWLAVFVMVQSIAPIALAGPAIPDKKPKSLKEAVQKAAGSKKTSDAGANALNNKDEKTPPPDDRIVDDPQITEADFAKIDENRSEEQKMLDAELARTHARDERRERKTFYRESLLTTAIGGAALWGATALTKRAGLTMAQKLAAKYPRALGPAVRFFGKVGAWGGAGLRVGGWAATITSINYMYGVGLFAGPMSDHNKAFDVATEHYFNRVWGGYMHDDVFLDNAKYILKQAAMKINEACLRHKLVEEGYWCVNPDNIYLNLDRPTTTTVEDEATGKRFWTVNADNLYPLILWNERNYRIPEKRQKKWEAAVKTAINLVAQDMAPEIFFRGLSGWEQRTFRGIIKPIIRERLKAAGISRDIRYDEQEREFTRVFLDEARTVVDPLAFEYSSRVYVKKMTDRYIASFPERITEENASTTFVGIRPILFRRAAVPSEVMGDGGVLLIKYCPALKTEMKVINNYLVKNYDGCLRKSFAESLSYDSMMEFYARAGMNDHLGDASYRRQRSLVPALLGMFTGATISRFVKGSNGPAYAILGTLVCALGDAFISAAFPTQYERASDAVHAAFKYPFKDEIDRDVKTAEFFGAAYAKATSKTAETGLDVSQFQKILANVALQESDKSTFRRQLERVMGREATTVEIIQGKF